MKLIKFQNFINESRDSALDWFKDLENDIEINYPEAKMINKIRIDQNFILCKLGFNNLSNGDKDKIKNEVIRSLELIEDNTDWGVSKVFYSFDGEHYTWATTRYIEKSNTRIDLGIDVKLLTHMEFLKRISECDINGLAFYLHSKIKSFSK